MTMMMMMTTMDFGYWIELLEEKSDKKTMKFYYLLNRIFVSDNRLINYQFFPLELHLPANLKFEIERNS